MTRVGKKERQMTELFSLKFGQYIRILQLTQTSKRSNNRLQILFHTEHHEGKCSCEECAEAFLVLKAFYKYREVLFKF